jgi:predicted DNA binding CopG/RHH family protein
MKQVNVRLQEDLIKKIKMFAIENDLSFQDVVTISLNELLFTKTARNLAENIDNYKLNR